MTGKPKPLSKDQLYALKHADGRVVAVAGRGSKQTLNGLISRGLADRARIGGVVYPNASWWAYLTEDGLKLAGELRGA